MLDQHKGGEQAQAHDHGRHGAGAPSGGSGADGQPPGECAEPDDGEQSSRRVQGPVAAVQVGGRIAPGQQDRAGGERQVDEEDGPPGDQIDQAATQHRAQGARGGAGGGPDADRPSFRLAGEGGAQDGEAVRHQQGSPGALDEARCDQPRQAGRQRAAQRGQREQGGPEDQDAPPPETVPGRAACQQEGAQRQEIGVHHPLQGAGVGREAAPDGRQADVDDAAIHKGEAGRQDGGRQHQAGMAHARSAGAGPGGGIAGGVKSGAHAHSLRLRPGLWERGRARCMFRPQGRRPDGFATEVRRSP